MIIGVVTNTREAVIPIEVCGPNVGRRTLQVVIDTGFTDYLTLPTAIIDQLGLPAEGAVRVTLAHEQTADVRVYLAEVVWDGAARVVPVLAMDGSPLVGMALLAGHWLRVHVVENGEVVVE